jgi:hypothetical protein
MGLDSWTVLRGHYHSDSSLGTGQSSPAALNAYPCKATGSASRLRKHAAFPLSIRGVWQMRHRLRQTAQLIMVAGSTRITSGKLSRRGRRSIRQILIMVISFKRVAYAFALGSLTLLYSTAATAFDFSSFVLQPVALTATDGTFGPQLGSAIAFTGFNGDPSISSTGEIAYPGDLSSNADGGGEGFWLHRGGLNNRIALTNTDGVLGPGLGNGLVFDNTFHEALVGAPGEVLLGGFVAGLGVNDRNNLVYVRHDPGGNVPLVRTGVSNVLGPGLGENVVFDTFYGAQINEADGVFLGATISGPGVTSATAEGFWRNTPAGNLVFARSGIEGVVGPGLGPGVTFGSGVGRIAFEQYQYVEGSDDVVFVGRTLTSATSLRGVGIWKNTSAGNAPLALTGATDGLGPGLGPSATFGDSQQIPYGSLTFDVNSTGTVAFFSTLSDNRRGLWRNLGLQNEPLMLVGESGALGPGLGIQDTFATFTHAQLLPDPAINDDNLVLFPGVLTNSRQRGLWLNDGDENQPIALTGTDGELGPGLGPGVKFTEFNRAYFGDADTVYFTAGLSFDVPFNRLLGLWARRNGKIYPIAIYNELIDVDPTEEIDQRSVEWVQIPSDFTYNNDYGANGAGQIAFRMGFQDGTQGIFVLALVPEPNSGLILVAMSLSLARFSRRAHYPTTVRNQ